MPYTRKSGDAHCASKRSSILLRVCKNLVQPCTTRRKQSTVAESLGVACSKADFQPAQLRFAVPVHIAHPRWRVSQTRIRWAADFRLPIARAALRFSFTCIQCNATLRSSPDKTDENPLLAGLFSALAEPGSLSVATARSGYSRNCIKIAIFEGEVNDRNSPYFANALQSRHSKQRGSAHSQGISAFPCGGPARNRNPVSFRSSGSKVTFCAAAQVTVPISLFFRILCKNSTGGAHPFLFRAFTLNQIGEPINPNFSRIWFARNRSKLKCSFTSLSVNSTNVGGATAACVM